jgi:hypothetical protein
VLRYVWDGSRIKAVDESMLGTLATAQGRVIALVGRAYKNRSCTSVTDQQGAWPSGAPLLVHTCATHLWLCL